MPFTAGSDIEDMMRYETLKKCVTKKRSLRLHGNNLKQWKSLPYCHFRIFFRKRFHPHHPHTPPPKKKTYQPTRMLTNFCQSTKKAESRKPLSRHLVGLQHAIEPRQQFLSAVVRVHQDLTTWGLMSIAWNFIRVQHMEWVIKANYMKWY